MKKQTLLVLASACLLISACGGGNKSSASPSKESSFSSVESSISSSPKEESSSSISSVNPSSSSVSSSNKPSSSSASSKPSSSSEKPSSSSSISSSSSTKPSSSSVVEKFKVYFERGGESVFPTQEVEKGKCATNPGIPSTTDTKVFREWQDENGKAFDFATPITKDIHLNAYFVFEVKFDLNGGVGTTPKTLDFKSYGSLELPNCEATKEGYVFNGWLEGEDLYKAGETYRISKSVTFKADWVEDSPVFEGYEITYKPGDHASGDPIVKKTADDGSIILEKGSIFTAESGYYFDCWYNEKNPSQTFDASTTAVFSAATTLVAKWKQNVAFIAYTNDWNGYLYFENTNDGTYATGGELSYDTLYVTFGYTCSNKQVTFTVFGHTYTVDVSVNGQIDSLHIAYNGTTIDFGTPEEIVYVEPTVTFNANGGSGTAPTVTFTQVVVGGDTKFTFKFPTNTFTAPQGKVFDAWYIGTNKYSPNTTYYANPGEVIEIKAGWVDAGSMFVVDGVLTNYYINEKNVVIPGDLGITSVAMNAFKNLNLIETIDFPESVKTIATGTFSNLPNIKSITLRSKTQVNAMGCYFALGGPKLTVYVPASLLTFDEEDNIYIYGNDAMGTQMFIFLPIDEGGSSTDSRGFIRHSSFQDICGTYKDPSCMVSTANYHTATISYDTNFDSYKILFNYKSSTGAERSISFADNMHYEEGSNVIYATRSQGGWARFGIKENGNLYLIELATSSSAVYSNLVNEFVKQ